MNQYLNIPLSLASHVLQTNKTRVFRLFVELKGVNHILTKEEFKGTAKRIGIRDARTCAKNFDYMIASGWIGIDKAGRIYLRSFRRITEALGRGYLLCVRVFPDSLPRFKAFLVSAICTGIMRLARRSRKYTRENPARSYNGVSITGLSTVLGFSRGYACKLRLAAVKAGVMSKKAKYEETGIDPNEILSYCEFMRLSPGRFVMIDGKVFRRLTDEVKTACELKRLRA